MKLSPVKMEENPLMNAARPARHFRAGKGGTVRRVERPTGIDAAGEDDVNIRPQR